MHLDDISDSSRPVTPTDEDCCHNDCQPCIFDVHLKLVENWQKKRKQGHIRRNNVLKQTTYKNFTIDNITEASSDHILVYLKYKDKMKDNEGIQLNPAQYVMINAWSTTRSYTPISWTDDSLVFLVKHYENGVFTSKLRGAIIGDVVNVRGPYGEFYYKRNSFRQITMFSIGSGIAVMYPIAKKIIDDDLEESLVHLVCGFRTIAHVPLTTDLQSLCDYWNFKCTIHVSQTMSSNFMV
ncbi:hypothetical protein KM043_001476 [Ampulex compressa]|nr:hypothetical protein KM043_001476 [Ampulex compressa]